MKKQNIAYLTFNIAMFTVLGFASVFLFKAEQAIPGTLPKFVGIDNTLTSHGFATVKYDGETYHLTEGDTIRGFTVVLIDTTDSEVIVKHNGYLKEIRFPSQRLNKGFTQEGLQKSSH